MIYHTNTQALLSEKQAAELLCISPKTMQVWRWRGKGPSYLKLGKAVRYRPEVLEEWLSGLQRSNTSQTAPNQA